MAGNSQRRGARRQPGSKKGAVAGSGGQRRRGLQGKGPTPKAEMRPGHPAQRRTSKTRASGAQKSTADFVFGRNAVVEALRAGVPSTVLYVALGVDSDDRVLEAVATANARPGMAVHQVSRSDLDRFAQGDLHQGLALRVKPYAYSDPIELADQVRERSTNPVMLALDGVTDPRNVGAIVRSAAAFGAAGLIVPTRRSAGVTASAWRTSAGALARFPVSRATNLVRTLTTLQSRGFTVVGLDGQAETTLDDADFRSDPLVLVIGSEGKGLSRLTSETCDVTLSIPIAAESESLNASIAAAVVLAEIARRRRAFSAR